ncbi:MAG: DUF2283 domain-containing protein [Anaerolineales bacterium]|nr:DUF2283 domain-containing protein [Anaerolineales bacterium]
MKLEKQELTLKTGQKVLYEYDPDGDLLEIIFQQAEATSAVELTESIILRFNWDTNQPLSLSFISISHLMQPSEYGEVHFQLLTDEWPVETKDKILMMLRQSPLNEFLAISSYTTAHTHQIIPPDNDQSPQLSVLVA